MINTFKKSLFVVISCLMASAVWAGDVTFTMSNIFDGNGLSFTVTTPTAATVSSNTSKGNAKDGKLGSDGHYFEIVLTNETFTAASINGYINTNNTDKNWAFQFSTDGGKNWSEEATQANDGNKTAHDIKVTATIPANANGFRVIRRAGTSTIVNSITLTLAGGTTPGGGDDPTPGGGDDPTPTTGDAYAHWRFSGSDAPAVGSSENGTKMTVDFLAKDESKTYSVESAGYNAAVPDDMKSQGQKGVKLGGNVLYLRVSIDGGFKAEDVVTICGYNKWKVSSTDEHTGDIAASVETGTSKSDYNIGTFTLSADASAIYMMRAEGTGTCICAIKVTRGGDTPEPPTTISVKGITVSPTKLDFVLGDNPKGIAYTITPSNATNQNVTWTSDKEPVATVDKGIVTAHDIGEATITVTTEDGGFTAECKVKVTDGSTPPVVLSDDATLKSLTYGGTSVPNFSPTTYVYNIELTAGIKTPPTIDAETNHAKATKVITQAESVPGSGKVVVTAEDGTTQLTYTINYTVSSDVPSTDLTLHQPDIYALDKALGGYGGTLYTAGGKEYEVYYMTRDADSKFCIATTNADKTTGITTRGSSDYSCSANDGWFKFSGTGWSSASDAMGAEFGTMSRRLDMDNTCEFTMHFSGFDQFALVARDKKKDTSSGQTKPDDNRYLEVYIDDVLQPLQFDASPSIRRYDVSPQEHVVRVIHHGSEKSAMYAFSLRDAGLPRTKWVEGDDQEQSILQTEPIAPIYYYTKFNQETKLEWVGTTGEEITLTKLGSDNVGDTLMMSGNANCPIGEYHYNIVSYYDGTATSKVSGTFSVITAIKALSDTVIEAYQTEEIDQIAFRYYALSTDVITLTWPNGNPGNLSGSGENGKYYITGTPTEKGTFPYIISIKDGNTITGKIEVQPLDLGNNPVLYLYKNEKAYNNDGIYNYLKTLGYSMNARKAKATGLREPKQYAKYKWVFISEDADADNAEILAVTKDGGSNLPVLNMNPFSYAPERLNWGTPDNGSVDTITHNGCNIFVEQENHPIFKGLGKSHGDKIQVLKEVNKKGIMPINIHKASTYCLGTAYTRSLDDYYLDGELQTAIHEIPAKMRGQKYICLPIAMSSSENLTNDGKLLLKNIVNYLLDPNTEAPIELPELQIDHFAIKGVEGDIDQTNNTIEIRLDITQFPDLDLSDVRPVITLADPKYSHVIPASGDSVDFSHSTYKPIAFVVTDYISRRVYNVSVRTYNPQGLDEVYSVGDWVNIFDIFGRKVATTNEDIYSMELPHGVYLIVTTGGKTMKIMR